MLLVQALNRLEVQPVRSRDSLRLSTIPRQLSSRQFTASDPGAVRGLPMQGPEAAQDQADLAAAPYRLGVGVYAVNNYRLDFIDPSYSSTGYLWYRWQQPLQDYLEKAKLQPEDVFVAINAIGENADSMLKPLGEGVMRLPDGSYYAQYSYRGQFYVDRLDFHRFPFNAVGLPIVIEADDPDGSLGYEKLRFVPDIRDSGVGGYGEISGWVNTGWTFAEYRHHFASGFGMGQGESDYSQAVFEVSYATSVWASFWTLLQPLLVVMTMVVLIAKLPGNLDDVRVGIPATVLLTLVFLQQAYQAELPKLPYLTFLDEVYVVSYGVALLTFLKALWVVRRRQQVELTVDAEAAAALKARIRVVDNLWAPVVVLLTVGSVLACWFWI